MPRPDLSDLKVDDCRLWKADTGPIDEFNATAEQLRRMVDAVPRFADDPPENLRVALDEFAAVRKKLRQPHYLVGFCGGSGLGKSTTLNHLLAAYGDDAPCKEGESKATTCSAMRLRAVPPGTPPAMSLAYLTPREYRDKRDWLCGGAKLAPDFEDRELREQLPEHRGRVEAGKVKASLNDIEMLERLLACAAAHGSRLADPPAADPDQPYADRRFYLNHTPVAPGRRYEPHWPNLLLREVGIDYPTDVLGDELELIDLPGLGQNAYDTHLTMKFLPDLDGVMLFVSTVSITEGSADQFLTELRGLYGQAKAARRIWLVVTYFDSLSVAKLYGDGGKEAGLFATLQQTVARHGLDPRRVCLISNKFHTRARQGVRQRRDVLDDLGVRPGDDAPPALLTPDGQPMRPAFEALLADGGIAALRDRLRHELPLGVRAETRDWCSGKLAEVRRAARTAVAVERRRAINGRPGLLAVSTCLTEVAVLSDRLGQRFEASEQEADRLRTKLTEAFDKAFPPNPVADGFGPGRLAPLFATHAAALDAEFRATFAATTVPNLFAAVARTLDPLPPVQAVEDAKTLAEAWARFAAADTASEKWWDAALVPTFIAPNLFAAASDPRARTRITGRSYRELMRSKIRSASHQAAMAVRRRLSERLQGVEVALRALAVPDPNAGPVPGEADVRRLDGLLRDLEDGRP